MLIALATQGDTPQGDLLVIANGWQYVRWYEFLGVGVGDCDSVSAH